LLLAFSANAQDIPTQLNGKLVALRGKSALPFAAPDLPKAKYIALYYSAGWCGPCRQFTPDLVKFYNEMKPSHPEFEIVFMSEDQGASAMEKYMSEMSMPWPAMRYSAVKGSRLSKFAGRGIPCLVLLNEKGELLSHSYEGDNYLGPRKVMRDLKKMLTGDASGIAAAGVEEDGRDTAGTRDQGDGEREDGDVLSVILFFLLAHGAGAHPGRASEDHVQSEKKKQEAARGPEGRQPDTQSAQQGVAREREDEQDPRAQERAPDRGLPLALLRVALRERREDGGQPQGVHDHQQRHERVEDEVRHGQSVAARRNGNRSAGQVPGKIAWPGRVTAPYLPGKLIT